MEALEQLVVVVAHLRVQASRNDRVARGYAERRDDVRRSRPDERDPGVPPRLAFVRLVREHFSRENDERIPRAAAVIPSSDREVPVSG